MSTQCLPNALQPLLLSLAIATSTCTLAAEQPHASAQLQHSIRFDIAAQSLPEALLSLAQQAGLRLSFASELVPEQPSSPLQGQMSVEQALQQLLRGQPIDWQVQVDGSVLLYRRSSVSQGQIDLPHTLVLSPLPAQGTTLYERQSLERMPVRQGKITELLRQNPAVAFDKSSLSSKTPGDLAAENVSINGAKYWDNNFSVDGISMNNDINPGGSEVSANASFTELPSNTSQGMNLDVSLLDSIEVYDSNVPAEFGGFTGGVINAHTRAPSHELAGSASISMTKDSWNHYYIDEDHEDDFYDYEDADGTAEVQPKFRTLTYRATLEGHLTDNFGLLGSVVRKQSDIYDQNVYAGFMADNGVSATTKKDLQQSVDNLFLKGVWQINERLNISGSINYAPQEAEYFNINTLNGGFDMQSGGLQTTLQANWQGDWGNWQHDLSWSQLEQSRSNGANYFKAWYYSADKNWADPTQSWNAAMEGTYGNIEQSQERLNYAVKLDLLPFHLASTQHAIKLGAGLDNTEARYSRDDEFTGGMGISVVPTSSCTTASGTVDRDWCSTSPVLAKRFWPGPWPAGQGQMFDELDIYTAGSINIEQRSWSAFMEDTMQWHNLNVRAGLRAEQNDFNNNLNLAPRLTLTWDLFSNGQSKIIAGANRYYGREIFDLRLREDREALNYISRRDMHTLEFGPRLRAGKNTTDLADLKTPYDDELSLGFEQIAFNTLFSLRYVKRNGVDQIHRQQLKNNGSQTELASTYYQYNNDGGTDSEHLYLTITPLQALSLWGSSTQASLAFGKSDVESSGRSYNDNYNDELVMYLGSPLKAYDMPVDNYNRPWTAKLVTQTQIPALNLTVGNFLNLRSGYAQVIQDGRVSHDGQRLRNYVEKDIGSALTWDSRIAWELPTGANEAVFVNLDIGNLLNRRNMIGSSSASNLNAEIDYELGRNYTLEVGYHF